MFAIAKGKIRKGNRNLLGLLASVPIVVVGFTIIKEFVSTGT